MPVQNEHFRDASINIQQASKQFGNGCKLAIPRPGPGFAGAPRTLGAIIAPVALATNAVHHLHRKLTLPGALPASAASVLNSGVELFTCAYAIIPN
jgi:hypothetical protein